MNHLKGQKKESCMLRSLKGVFHSSGFHVSFSCFLRQLFYRIAWSDCFWIFLPLENLDYTTKHFFVDNGDAVIIFWYFKNFLIPFTFVISRPRWFINYFITNVNKLGLLWLQLVIFQPCATSIKSNYFNDPLSCDIKMA